MYFSLKYSVVDEKVDDFYGHLCRAVMASIYIVLTCKSQNLGDSKSII